MSLVTALYMIDLISRVNIGLRILTFLVGLILFICFIAYFHIEKEDFKVKLAKKLAKKLVIAFLCLVIAIFFIPSERTVYLMASSHYMTQTGIPEKVLKVLNEKLDKIIETSNDR